jgi:hypothetical protein
MSSIVVAGDTSGTITIAAPASAGSGTLTLPVATDTLVGKATTDTLTNKSIAATQLTGVVAVANGGTGVSTQIIYSEVIQATRAMNATTGSVAYTGVGFTPKTLSIIAIKDGNSATSFGISTGLTEYCTSKYGGSATVQSYIATRIVYFSDDSGGANIQEASIVSLDADGFTLSWARTGTASTGNIQLLITANA